MVAASGSGVGKTSVTAGLCRAWQRQGKIVQTFKVGPDYLDPTLLTAASGRSCHNLDPWMMAEEAVLRLFQSASQGADVVIIEGVMGLFDGASAISDQGSTAALARALALPVLLILDGSGCARTFAATAFGMTCFPGAPDVAGVIANRIGGPSHRQILTEALASVPQCPPLLGGIPKGALPGLSSRHLGLVPADEIERIDETLEKLADAVAECVDMETLWHHMPQIPKQKALHLRRHSPFAGLRLGVAQDEAFRFYYPDLWLALAERGVEIVPFSPLSDSTLPQSLQGLILGGGYPEIYAEQLAANVGMRSALQTFAQAGGVVYAECGGLMYLSRGIVRDGLHFDMCGVLPAWTQMNDKLRRLGYVQVKCQRDGLLGRQGEQLRGHEFHYSELAGEPEGWERLYHCTNTRGDQARSEGYMRANVLASYIHIPLAAHPTALDSLLQHCLEGKP